MSINNVNISGNLVRDAELVASQAGYPILNFCVAVNDRQRNKETNEWEDYPNYIDCTLFGNLGSSIEQYMKKGMKVSVSGKLRQNRWEKDGQKQSKIKIIVDDIEFMAQSHNNQQPSFNPPMQNTYQPAAQPQNVPNPFTQPPATAPVPAQTQPAAQPPMPAVQQVAAPAPTPVIDPASSVYDDGIPF